MNLKLIFIFLLGVLGLNNCTILITQPLITNFTKNQIPFWFANFGTIHYNKPMSFAIATTNSSLCGQTQQQNNKQLTTPTYLVVKQGGCSFPKKAFQAQKIGAQGILFASKEVDYAEGNTVISDDGTGRKVRISALFINPDSFDKIGNLQNARIKVNFQIKQSSKSNVTFFISASGRQNYIFLRNFRDYYNKIIDKINLNIVYHTIQCKGCSQSECILQNTCCAFDLDNYQSGMGKFIIYQQFRQYKLYKYLLGQNKIDSWFQYMDKFDKRCDYDWINSQACGDNILKQLGVNSLSMISEFDVMMEWRRVEVKTGIISLPDLSVNGFRHVQELNAENAFNMICQSLTNQPSACNSQQQLPKNNKGHIIAIVAISSIVFIVAGICCYRKIIRRQITNDMTSKVDELVAKYAAKVSEQKKQRKDKLLQRMTQQL